MAVHTAEDFFTRRKRVDDATLPRPGAGAGKEKDATIDRLKNFFQPARDFA